MMQGILNECYVHIERLPEHIIKKSFIKVDIKYETSFQEIKINENVDLKDIVSHSVNGVDYRLL